MILDGKYWKRRLDKVSREHKKWRRHLEDKLLRSGGLSREQLVIDESEEEDDDYSHTRGSEVKGINIFVGVTCFINYPIQYTCSQISK